MSKKTSTAAKQPGKTATLSLKHKAEAQKLAQNLEGLQPEAQAAASAQAAVVAKADQIDTQSKTVQEPLQAGREEAAREVDSAARADAILTAVQDFDHGGQSLLIEAAAAAAAKEEKDDKAAAWQWSDTLPWLAALGGVAALASIKPGSGDTPGATGATGASGVVFDTPVTNAIVFRDTNGNGKWDSGESITVTDSQGRFSSLGGTGNIVATSLDRLVVRINNEDVTFKSSEYAAFNAVSGLRLTSGVAIDVGTDLDLGTGDDFVWSGTYTAASAMTQGAVGVYVTAVSSLVTAYLAEQGITAPTQAQIDAAVTQLKAIFAYDDSTGVSGQGANVQFYTSDLNGQVTKIMGEAIGKAQAAGTDVQQAIADALETLAQAAADAYDAEATLDLTDSGDLASIFGLTAAEADALALQTSSAGPAVYSIWYTEDGNAQATAIDGVDTIQNDGPIGNITVLTQGEGSSADLTVEPTDGSDALSLQQAHVLVQSAGDGSAANLTLSSTTGTITEVIVRADGDVGAVGGPTWRTFIEDGGADQYDDGNYIGTWTKAEYDLAVSLDTVSTDIYPTSVAYSGTVADDNFGTGSQNVAVYQDSIFGMLVTGNTSDTFSITGHTGQDLAGSSEDLLTLAEYNGYQAIVIRSYGEEPSMNRVFIFKADANVTVAPLDEVADTEDYFISGLSGVDQFGYFVVYGSSDVEAIASDDLEAFFHTAVDEVLSAASAADMSTAFYDSDVQTALRGNMSLYTEFTNYEYSVDGAFTLLSSDVSLSADSTANADIDFSGDVQGNIHVAAAGDSADASLTLHSTSGAVNLQGGDVSASATGAGASADLHVHDAAGTIGSLGVTATGDNADAYVHLSNAGASADLLTVANINVSANTSGNCGDVSAQASLDLDGNMAVTGDITVTAAGSADSAYISGDTEHLTLGVAATSEDAAIVSNISVTASGQSSDAGAEFTNATGDVGKLSATASAAHSTANLTISNSGSDGELVLHGVPGTVTTVVPGSVFFQTNALDGEQGLTYSGYTGTSSEVTSVDALEPTFSGTSVNVDYTWGSGDVLSSGAADDVQVHWTGFIRWPGETGELTSVNFYDRSDDGFILKLNGNAVISNWEEQSGAEEPPYNGQGSYEAVAGDLVQVDIWYSEYSGYALAQLYWDQPTPPVAVDVTASSADATATTTITADVHIEAAIVVEASGACADATADINTSGSTHTVLGLEASDISVTASGNNGDANAYIHNASGAVANLSVTASGNGSNTDALLSLGTEGDGVTAASLTVTADGTNADASADISGDIAITGDLNVSAMVAGANASADINVEGSGATVLGVAATSEDVAVGSNITVLADVATATAALNIGNASGTVESLDVTANDGTATLDIGVADESTLTISTVDVTSNGTGHASADVYGAVDSTVAITGNVTVTANGAVDPAYLYVNGTDANGGTVLGTDEETATNDITVNASNGADAYAFLNNASGQADQLTINAQGGNAEAGLDIGVASGDELAVASLSVTADGSNDSADAYLWNHGASSELTITGNIEVAAGGSGAYAYAEINQFDWERDGNGEWAGGDAQGHVVLGVAGVPEVITTETTTESATVNGRLVTITTTTTEVTPAIAGSAGDLTVTAGGDNAVASADIRAASGSVDEISVTASGADAGADLTLRTESYNSIDGVTAATLTVTASDDSADAGADISGDVTITGAVSVTASGTSSDATIDINTSGSAHTVLGVSAVPEQLLSHTEYSGDIVTTVTVVKAATAASAADLIVEASASSADAGADIHNASGVVANISVTASGTDASADLTLQTESHNGVDGVTAASLTVTASGDAGDAISADAGADAHADILGDVTITGAIDVTASGASADATAHINDNHAGSTVLGLDGVGSDLTVTASAYQASAAADIRNVSGAVEDILVQATVASADASLYLEVASGEELDVDSLTVSSDIYPTDASADASVIIRGNVSIAGDITVTGGDGSSLDINTSGEGQTTLGGGNLTLQATGADSDAEAFIENASGAVGNISATATNWDEEGEQYAYTYLDLRVAEDKQLQTGTITVEANGSADAQADINGNLSITGDIVIEATGADAYADAEINNAGFDASYDMVVTGETRLNGGDISVDAHDSAEAIGWIHNASGRVGNVMVSASGDTSNAALDLSALQPGQHQVQKITLSEQTLSALGDGDDVQIYINGEWFSHTMGQCAYMNNEQKLAEVVQAFRDSGNYDNLGADIYQEGNSLVIRWNDYGSHPDPRALRINGQETGFSQSVNAEAPSLAFASSDVTVEALFGENTNANLAVDGTTGTLDDIRVGAVFAQNSSASASIGFNGNMSGDVVVEAIGDGNDATLDLHADPSGRITLSDFGCNDVHVGAMGLEAHAMASLSGLDGQIDHIDIYADVKNAEASANLQFANGSVTSACMDAIDHQSTVRLTVEQGEQNGYVNVAGQGHAAVTYYVDADNNTADEINLWAMHGSPLSGDTDSNDWWGYADIDLVAKYNDVLHQPGTGLQTNCNDTLWNNRMEVNDFNVQRDSINVILQDDADGDDGTQNHLVRHEVAFVHSGDLTVAEGTEFNNAIDDLLYDARNYFDNLYSGAAGQGYYYREITVDPAEGSNYVRSFLVYDYELGTPTFGSGDASGLIELGGTTGLSWRNVADRYDIESQVQTGGYLSQSHDLVDVHAIDKLTVGAYDDGENYQTYMVSHEADAMVSDITVEALNPGNHGSDDATRAALDLSSKASDGCGDSYLELRQSDVNVIAQGHDYWDAYASAELSLRDAWGTLNSITVEANDNADATAELKYLGEYWDDYTDLGSVKVHDVDVRAMGYYGDARLSTEYSDLTFDHSVVNVTVGYDAQGRDTFAVDSTASLDVNRWDNRGYVDGVISQLNVAAQGDNNCADVEFNYYAGDIDSLRVTADGWYSSADADVQFSNDSVINAVQSIYIDASGHGTDAHAYIHATDSLKDIQITGGDIYVGAYSADANAGLDMDEVQVTGQVNQIVVEADSDADAWASISGNGLSVTHERDGDLSNDWTDSSIRVSASDHSTANLAISGYGQYLDSVILNANDGSDTYFSLGMRGFIDTLDIQVNGDHSYVSADITQQTYGGVVNISASENDYVDGPEYIDNVVDLAYRTATAKAINIDNSGRDFVLGDYTTVDGFHFVSGDLDDTLSLNLMIDVADEDIVYTNHAALLDYHSVSIGGWTDNDSISFNGASADVATNYEESDIDWSSLNTLAHPDRGIARLFQEADAALDGTVDYYFGVCGDNGYLFHDEDGNGITTVVELMGVTAFDYHQINGNTPT